MPYLIESDDWISTRLGDRSAAKTTRMGDSDSFWFSDGEYIGGATSTIPLNMTIPAPQQRIGQAFKYSEKNGMLVTSVYVSWQNDPIKFCHTRVHGTQPLPTNRCDKDVAFGFYASWEEAKEQFQNLVDSYGYTICEPLMPLGEVMALVLENRSKLDKSLDYLASKA